MEPISLRGRLPRSARAEVAGIVFLPRSIDKVRATLPGGDIADYKIPGFTEQMLDGFGISVEDFTEAVRTAQNDDEVGAYVRAHAKDGGIEGWNDFARNRQIYNGDRTEAIEENPWLADHPELIYSLDFLDYKEQHGLDDD
ncbi:MAG: DUF5069 domain-containing protein [Candidatus Baltobacteraceae bacterium]